MSRCVAVVSLRREYWQNLKLYFLARNKLYARIHIHDDHLNCYYELWVFHNTNNRIYILKYDSHIDNHEVEIWRLGESLTDFLANYVRNLVKKYNRETQIRINIP